MADITKVHNIIVLTIIGYCTLFLGCSNQKHIKGKLYYKKDYGENWPFSIDSIDIYCAGAKEIYVEKDGIIYPLNGSAKGASRRSNATNDINTIWMENKDLPGTKIPLPNEFIGDALKLCSE